MGYKVVQAFADSCDAGYVYRTGDAYPRDGVEPTPLRIAELASTANTFGFPLIEMVEEPGSKAENSTAVEKETPPKTTKRKSSRPAEG